jgi:hypothetical protein
MTEPTDRDRQAAENALSTWGVWTGFSGSLRLRDAVASGIAAAREEGRREERRRKSMPHTCTSCGLETMLVWGEGA